MTLPFDQLTETEKACLRLVYRGLSSRQIAAERMVRSDSIDRIVLTARQKLGDLPRHEVARLLVEHEATQEQSSLAPAPAPAPTPVAGCSPTQFRGAPRSGLPDPPLPLPSEPVEQPGERSDGGTKPWTGDRLDGSLWPAFRQHLLGSDGSLRNDLDTFFSVAAITITAAGAACVAAALISLLDVFDRYAIGH